MRKAIIAAAVALAAAAAPAQAASEGSIDYFTAENVSEAVRELGATNVEIATVEGVKIVRLEHSGYRFSFAPQVCKDRPGCVGLLLMAGINTQGSKYPLEVVNSFNRKVPPVTTVSFDDGNIALWRALVSEGGMSKANMRANMTLLMGALPLLLLHLQGQVVASSEGGAGRAVPVAGKSDLQSIHLSPQHLKELMAEWPAAIKKP